MQTVAHFQRTPCETCVFHITFQLVVTGHFILFLVDLHQRVFLDPVDVLFGPLYGVFLVAAYTIGLAHGSKPFVAVQLPAQFVVLYRPVSPVDVFTVVE